jgi:CHAD domain-containing protein
VVEAVKWKENCTARANAQQELPVLVGEYFAHVRELLAKDPSPKKLHAIRLATKRLRYTLELFRPCYGTGFETRIAELRKVQQILGEVNDLVAGRQLLEKTTPKVRKFLEERAEAKAREFRTQWSEGFDAPGREEWWTGYLRRASRGSTRVARQAGM